MTSPFRSLAGPASRRRARSVVERSTFVIVELRGERFALPVELVERVVRMPAGLRHVRVADQDLALIETGSLLGLAPAAGKAGPTRTLIVRDRSHWWALEVDAVIEVCAVETATITPCPADASGTRRGARVATFERPGQTIVVLDLLRLLPDVAS